MSPTPLPRALTVNSTIKNTLTGDTYRLIDKLGQGGFGTAYEAHIVRGGVPETSVCIKITTDPNSWHGEAFLGNFLKGSTLDYVKEGLKQAYKFENPNVDAMCGCGESFSVKSVNE